MEDSAIEASPRHAAALTTSIQPFKQQPPGLTHILPETATVATNPKILDVALEMSSHMLQHGLTALRAQFRQPHAQCLEFLPDAFALSLAANNEASAASTPDEVRDAVWSKYSSYRLTMYHAASRS